MKVSSAKLIDAKAIVKQVKLKSLTIENVLPKKETSLKKRAKYPAMEKENNHCKTRWQTLNCEMNKFYQQPSVTDLNFVNRFFNKSQCVYEWSAAKLSDIPSEQVTKMYAELKQDTAHDFIKDSRLFPGKTKYPFQLVNPLPEIAFLGKTNVGKSTILNNLNTKFQNKDLDSFARMSSRAGFTKTLNCYNIGNRFRLVDTPGYGFHSSGEQGDITTQYLLNRKELRRCFVLISAESMLTMNDEHILEYLTENGIPFEIVLTKMDKIKNVDRFLQQIDNSNIKQLPTLPKLIFTNSKITKHLPKRFGIDYLRYSIFESCGLDPSIKPQKLNTQTIPVNKHKL